MALRAALVAVAASAALVAAASTAHAGEMVVDECGSAHGTTDITIGGNMNPSSTGVINATNDCATGGPLTLTMPDNTLQHGQSAFFSFDAPANTRVSRVISYERDLTNFGQAGSGSSEVFAHYLIHYTLFAVNATAFQFLERCERRTGCPPGTGTRSTLDLSGTPLNGTVTKLGISIDCSDDADGSSDHCDVGNIPPTAHIYDWKIALADDTAPVVSGLGGALASAPTLSGSAQATAAAADTGVGVYKVSTSVDGGPASDSIVDTNGGLCDGGSDNVFKAAQPCRLATGVTATLDTTKIPNGRHHVRVTVSDAAGNATPMIDRDVDIANAGGAGGGGASSGVTGKKGAATGPLGTLKASWLRGHRTSLTAGFGSGATVSGTLRDPSGKPLAGQPITVTAQPRDSSPSVTATGTTTATGSFRVKVAGREVPSKVLVSYVANGTSLNVPLVLSMRAKVTLSVTPKRARRRSGVVFVGRLLGVRNAKRLIDLQVRQGKRWQNFDGPRTSTTGSFRSRRRFKSAGTYRFRARVRPQEGFPYALGYSRSTRVRVR